MTVTATPTLSVAGLTIAGAAPVAPPPGLVAIDTLRITWGRTGVLDETTPATASLTVLDTTAGATFARRTDLIGQPVVLGWAGATSSTGVNFRGRITDVDVQPRTGNGATGFVVSLVCSSKLVDAANYRAPKSTTWPLESFSLRLSKIRTLLPASFFAGDITYPTRAAMGVTDPFDPSRDTKDYLAAPMDVSGTDALTILRRFFRSVSPLPMIYDPVLDRVTYAPRRRYQFDARGSTFTTELALSAAGRYMAQGIGGLPLPAGGLRYSGTLAQPFDSAITRIEVSYLDGAASNAQRTKAVALGGNEAVIGRRTYSVDSIHSEADYAQQLANVYADIAAREGAGARLGQLVYDTADHAGGFDTAAHRTLLLAGSESTQRVFLGGSWLTRLGFRPLVGFIGGTIEYAGGHWTLMLSPISVGVTDATVPLTFTTAAKRAVTAGQFDSSVAFSDFQFIEVGAGYTIDTQPPWGGNPS